MIIIADSGSTKTDWCLIGKNWDVKTVQTIGLNPYFLDEDGVIDVLKKDLYPFLDNKKVERVFFYGSGCSAETKKQVLQYALDFFFMHADIDVNNDLLGAARALRGMKPGLVCILGTGSSSCLYDGNDIVERLPSLGYILGDEGSGAYLGRVFVSAYLNGELPEHLQRLFDQKYNMALVDILDRVYKHPFPNRFLASFVDFLVDNKSDSFVSNLVYHAFDAFIKKQVLRYGNIENYPLCFTGSVSFLFADELRKAAESYGLKIDKIEQTPMQGLLEYHRNIILTHYNNSVINNNRFGQ